VQTERLYFEVPSDLTWRFREFQAYGNGQFNLIGTASALNPSFCRRNSRSAGVRALLDPTIAFLSWEGINHGDKCHGEETSGRVSENREVRPARARARYNKRSH